jgi:2-C-methyl-D-erythritol 4-phosphate cytidylyltransferase
MGARRPKALLPLGGRPLFLHSVERFARLREVRRIVLVAPDDCLAEIRARWGALLGRLKVGAVVAGGTTRHASVRRGVEASDPACPLLLIHDAARPFVSGALIRRVARAAARAGAALPALEPPETVKQIDGAGLRTLDRARIRLAQTPQGFRSDKLRRALARLGGRGAAGLTDDVQLFERLGWPVAVVEGEAANVKITYPEQLRAARRKHSR